MDRELYRRRQRRRAFIGWATGVLVVAGIVAAVVFGGEGERTTTPSPIDLFSTAMTSSQYEEIHKGESQSLVLNRLGSVGLQEDEVEGSELLSLFPARPDGATCSYWTLSDAPGHLVRLCFSDPQGVLLQKAVAARGESAAPTTLA